MQRDMQRLGEAAGVAAALAAKNGGTSRSVDIDTLQGLIKSSAIPANGHSSSEASTDLSPEALLSAGNPGIHLWQIYQDQPRYTSAVTELVSSENPQTSFYAATILAMWEDQLAESRFINSIEQREEGIPPSPENTGAFGQEIDIPFWLLAVTFLRRCGSSACLPTLKNLAARPDNILNVRTAIALTVERLTENHRIPSEDAADIAQRLIANPLPNSLLALSRSTWRTLRNEQQIVLRNGHGADVQQDHTWQLDLIVARILKRADRPPHPRGQEFLSDPRATVRQAFARVNEL